MKRVTVLAQRWKLGWDLQLVDGGATQVRTLDRAVQQVHDYLDTVDEDTNHDDWIIDIIPDLGSLIDEVEAAKDANMAAAKSTRAAAKQMRTVVGKLQREGLSVTDISVILGVSRGRVSQLTAAA